jgi:hypothetical protein
MDHPSSSTPDDPGEPAWTIPLHGAEIANGETSASASTAEPYLPPDEDVPPLDFQPRLTRFGEAA